VTNTFISDVRGEMWSKLCVTFLRNGSRSQPSPKWIGSKQWNSRIYWKTWASICISKCFELVPDTKEL